MSYDYREQLALAKKQPATSKRNELNWKMERHPGFVRHVCSTMNANGQLVWTGYSTALRPNQNKPAMYTPSMCAESYAELVRQLKEPEKQLKRY